jgi:hypothetical protein
VYFDNLFLGLITVERGQFLQSANRVAFDEDFGELK